MDSIVFERPMVRCPCHGPARLASLLGCIALAVGCSSRTEPWPTAVNEPAAARVAKDTAAGTIPEVITKPRLFELPPSLARAALPALPSIEPIAFPIEDSPTVAEVRGMMRDYVAAISRHDAAALAAHWAENGENVDLESGATVRGRDGVRNVFASFFEEQSDAAIDVDVTSVRPIRDEVAVVDGVSSVRRPGDSPARSRFSAVVAKRDGRWLIESIRESRLTESESAAVSRPLQDFAWLIGHWETACPAAGAVVGSEPACSTHCFWSAREAYIVRSHSVAPVEHAAGHRAVSLDRGNESRSGEAGREITEIIGWDPATRSIRSWLFSSDGGFGEATWTQSGDRTVVLVDGTLVDGTHASGTLTIARLGPDEISCRVAGDGIERLLPPIGDSLRTARSATSP